MLPVDIPVFNIVQCNIKQFFFTENVTKWKKIRQNTKLKQKKKNPDKTEKYDPNQYA